MPTLKIKKKEGWKLLDQRDINFSDFLEIPVDPRYSWDRGVFVCKQPGTMNSYIPQESLSYLIPICHLITCIRFNVIWQSGVEFRVTWRTSTRGLSFSLSARGRVCVKLSSVPPVGKPPVTPAEYQNLFCILVFTFLCAKLHVGMCTWLNM